MSHLTCLVQSSTPNFMREKLIKEINRGRIAGPFSKKTFLTLQLSPAGLVAQKDGDHRMIHHLYYPDSQSINDFIEEKHCKVTYSNIDQAAEPKEKLIKSKEQIRSLIFKKDNSKRNAVTAWSTQFRM